MRIIFLIWWFFNALISNYIPTHMPQTLPNYMMLQRDNESACGRYKRHTKLMEICSWILYIFFKYFQIYYLSHCNANLVLVLKPLLKIYCIHTQRIQYIAAQQTYISIYIGHFMQFNIIGEEQLVWLNIKHVIKNVSLYVHDFNN